VTLHTYQEDARKKATRRAFLGGRPVPQGLEKDDPTFTTVATVAADEHDETYEILSR
jgi:hypothetical protein